MFRNDDGYRWTFELISLRVVVVLCVVSHCSINGDAGAQSYTSDYAVAGQQRFPTSDENGRDSLLNRLVSTTASDAHNISDQTEALKSSHGSGLSLNSDTQRSGEKILSRRRRYLIFPPGSSVQIVYDTYHPILGYSNYLILGITAALAWELPSKPIYLNEELQESYQMGNLPLLKRKDANVTYVDANTQPPTKTSNVNKADLNYYYTNVPLSSPYYATAPLQRIYYKKPTIDNGSQSDKLQYYLSYADKFVKEFEQLTQQIPKDRPFTPAHLKGLADSLTKKLGAAKRKESKLISVPIRKHLIHPVFKRQTHGQLDHVEQYDLKLHRTTRQKLYKQIEKFLQTQGSKGADCVLKTLCETGQRDTDEQPGSMVVELLRAVFTLPEGHKNELKYQDYDRAHRSKRNCHELFPACTESIWTPKFHY